MPSSDSINWVTLLTPVVVTVGGGTIIGNIIVAKYKERIDRRLAILQRRRDKHIARADSLRKVIAALVGARTAAGDARHTDVNKKSNIPDIAARSKAVHESHVANFSRLSDEALVESERYGLIDGWCALPDRSLSSYVDFVLHGRLGFALDADSIRHGESGDAYRHATALVSDLRALVDAEESMAEDVFATGKRQRTFLVPELPYLNMLKVYFDGEKINVRKLDTSVLENRIAQQEYEEEERQERIAKAKQKSLSVDAAVSSTTGVLTSEQG